MVWRAHDLATDRPVAIKLLHPDLSRSIGSRRFLREISILSQLSHANILTLLDSGAIELPSGLDVPWFTTPLVEEQTLRIRLRRAGPLPLTLAIRHTRDLCAALSHAHKRGFVHRDLKPENILFSEGRALLGDFGIARAVVLAGGEALSSMGIVVGTPAYMSPEQSAGSDRLDGRSDLYSLGIVFYEMLAGQPPFGGSTPQAIQARQQIERPAPIQLHRPELPDEVSQILMMALAKRTADRFATAEQMEEALGATLGEDML